MGCDIHIYTELRDKLRDKRSGKDGVGTWRNVDNWRLNPYQGEGEREYECSPIYYGRSYWLFAILADVRQYTPARPVISKPKGLPDDVTDVVKQISDEWGIDGHSHSYLSLLELHQFCVSNIGNENRARIADLMKAMDARYRDEAWVFHTNPLTAEEMENIRIVFWFDN